MENDITDFAEETDSAEDVVGSLLLVSNVPRGYDQEDLTIHFLKRDNGGSGFAKLFEISKNSFILQLQSPAVARNILTIDHVIQDSTLKLSQLQVVGSSAESTAVGEQVEAEDFSTAVGEQAEFEDFLIADYERAKEDSPRARDDSHSTRELQRMKDDLQRVKDKLQRATDELQRVKDNSQRAKDNLQRTRDNSSKVRDDSHRARDDLQRARDNSPRAKVDSQRARDGSQRVKDKSPRAKDNSQSAKDNSQRARNDSQRAKNIAQRVKDDAQRAKDNSQRVKDDAQRAKDNAQRAKDIAQRAKDNSQRVRDETQRVRDDSQRVRDDSQRVRDDLTEARHNTPRAKDNSSYARDDLYRTRDHSHNVRYNSSRARDDSPRARDDSPRARDDSPRARDNSPRARDDSPRARDDTPRAREDPSREGAVAAGFSNELGSDIKATLKPGVCVYVMRIDICAMRVGAIVNAANGSLKHGGGVAYAISSAGGARLLAQCDEIMKGRKNKPITVEDNAVTAGHNLPCDFIIHAVGPQSSMLRSSSGLFRQLGNTVCNALKRANELRVSSVALPAISCGIYGMPIKEGCKTICKSAIEFLFKNPESSVNQVFLVGIGDEVNHLRQALIDLCGSEKIMNVTDEQTAEYVSGRGSTACEFCDYLCSAAPTPGCGHRLCFTCRKLCEQCSLHVPPARAESPVSDDDDLGPTSDELERETPDKRSQPAAAGKPSAAAANSHSSTADTPPSRITSTARGTSHITSAARTSTQAKSNPRGSSQTTSTTRTSGQATSTARTSDQTTSTARTPSQTAATPASRSPRASGDAAAARAVDATHATRMPSASANEADDKCPICLGPYVNPKQLPCNHRFCSPCIAQWDRQVCPQCRVPYGRVEGDMPRGTMDSRILRQQLPGYTNADTIQITYHFSSGMQSEKHPHPGKWYSGTTRIAYLPNNQEGQKVHRLLRKAFDQKLTFTVGRSATTGMEDCVVWNNIHHKTVTHGSPYGYPDPSYLQRVTEELKAAGVTE